MKKMITIADREYSSTWTGRSLENYKQMHRSVAEKKGTLNELLSARTLTAARIAAYGEKPKKVGVCGCKQERCERYGRGKSDAC